MKDCDIYDTGNLKQTSFMGGLTINVRRDALFERGVTQFLPWAQSATSACSEARAAIRVSSLNVDGTSMDETVVSTNATHVMRERGIYYDALR